MSRRPPKRAPIATAGQYKFRQRMRNVGFIAVIIAVLMAILYLTSPFLLSLVGIKRITSNPTPTTIIGPLRDDLTVAPAPDGEVIGISGGATRFDAKSDAENLIYQEDKRVLQSNHPHITVVVGAILTGTFAGSGEDSLQGAYVAQKEYNDTCFKSTNCLPVRLLIANSGSGKHASDELAYADLVAEQIVKARRADNTLVGVMGWPASSDLVDGGVTFGQAHIPVVTPTALLISNSYIFSVAPSNVQQGAVGAYYAKNTLGAHKVVIFVDPVDRYSESLADAFRNSFADSLKKYTIVATEKYTVNSPNTVATRIQDALSNNPDLIYFAGHANDVRPLLTNLPACSGSSCLNILGGDALYELGNYTADLRDFLFRVHFTSFAYPDEWGILAGSTDEPSFFSEYSQAFNPDGTYKPGVYGHTRADSSVILSYDAMKTLLSAANTTFNDPRQMPSPDALQRTLVAQSRQGISGKIAFDVNGTPIDKTMLALYFDSTAHIHEDQCFGTFLEPGLTNSASRSCLSIPA